MTLKQLIHELLQYYATNLDNKVVVDFNDDVTIKQIVSYKGENDRVICLETTNEPIE